MEVLISENYYSQQNMSPVPLPLLFLFCCLKLFLMLSDSHSLDEKSVGFYIKFKVRTKDDLG